MVKLQTLIFLFFIINSCAPIRPYTAPDPDLVNVAPALDLSDSGSVTTLLMEQYSEWKGTPYSFGGLNHNGVDCSGFIYITFRSMGIELPRSTASQVKVGSEITRKSLRTADLVFFKTGMFSRHVGVYLNDSKFLHASTSKGVIISSLDEEYWNEHYWVARRIN